MTHSPDRYDPVHIREEINTLNGITSKNIRGRTLSKIFIYYAHNINNPNKLNFVLSNGIFRKR